LLADNFYINEENESVQVLFGQNVKKYRKLAGLTQEQLSERLGVSQKHLSIIETGAQFASASLSRITDFKKYLIFFDSSDIRRRFLL